MKKVICNICGKLVQSNKAKRIRFLKNGIEIEIDFCKDHKHMANKVKNDKSKISLGNYYL